MRDENCIFCKIIAGEIPSNTIFEDDNFKVIMDVSPATKGHSLILPKNHYANLMEIDDAVVAEVFPLAKKIATHMKKVLGCAGVNVTQNNGAAAGQTVDHFHVHVIPRYEDDADKRICLWNPGDVSDEDKADAFEKLKL